MQIKTIKELDSVLAICRKRGVSSIEIGNVKLHLTDELPTKPNSEQSKEAPSSDLYTEEQILNWSSLPLGASDG